MPPYQTPTYLELGKKYEFCETKTLYNLTVRSLHYLEYLRLFQLFYKIKNCLNYLIS